MPYEHIRYEQDRDIVTITIDRPGTLNALAPLTSDEIVAAMRKAGDDDSVRVVILTGAGEAFTSGGDTRSELLDLHDLPPFAIKYNYEARFQGMIRSIKELEKPVIGAINGPAIGSGLDLALACDLRIASDTARFGAGWVHIGLIHATGGFYFFPQLVGMGKANELIMTGNIIDGQEAYRIGLVNKVVPRAELAAAAMAMAEKLADKPPPVLAAIKRGVQRAYASSLDAELSWASYVQVACFKSSYYVEGSRAVREKRRPRFREMK